MSPQIRLAEYQCGCAQLAAAKTEADKFADLAGWKGNYLKVTVDGPSGTSAFDLSTLGRPRLAISLPHRDELERAIYRVQDAFSHVQTTYNALRDHKEHKGQPEPPHADSLGPQ
jgi:hypothetical protein